VEGFFAISADNWKGGVELDRNTSEAENRHRTPFPVAPVTTQPAAEAYTFVLLDIRHPLSTRHLPFRTRSMQSITLRTVAECLMPLSPDIRLPVVDNNLHGHTAAPDAVLALRLIGACV